MKILDLFIIRKFLTTFFFVIFIFIVIAIVFDISEKVDDFIENKVPIGAIVFDYYLNFIPYYCLLFSPLFIFVAVIFFTAKMANQSEIVVILGSGVSFYRFLVPYFIAGSILAFLSYYISSWVLPPANKERIDFDNQYIRGSYINTKRNIHLKNPQDPTVFYYVENYSTKDSTGFRFAIEKIVDGKLVQKLNASRAKWSNRKQKWEVYNYFIRDIDSLKEKITRGGSLDTMLAITPEDFARPLDEDISQMTNTELDAYIASLIKKGKSNVAVFQVEKHKRYSVPFSTFILTMIGVALSSRKVRGGIGLQLAIGIGISFTYIVLMQFSTIFAVNASFSPFWAAWTPNIIYGILAFILIRLAPK